MRPTLSIVFQKFIAYNELKQKEKNILCEFNDY